MAELNINRDQEKEIIAYASFESVIMANLAKTKLDAYGVPCFLSDELLGEILPLNYLTQGQVRLHIFKDDIARVDEILKDQEGPFTAQED